MSEQYPIDSDSLKSQILKADMPKHIAIIMDGNGRWAQRRLKPRILGHRAGVASVRRTVEAAAELGVQVLTLFAFSEENWGRPKDEIAGVFALLDKYIVSERQTLADNNIKFKVIGRLDALPVKTRERVLETEAYLQANTGLTLVIALSYGSRQEVAHACRQVAALVQAGQLLLEDITSEVLAQNLWTSGLPDPDLLIRTSGEQRISNFLLWQLAYAELWFTNKCWPDFQKDDLFQAIFDFQNRERRYGLAPKQNLDPWINFSCGSREIPNG